MATTQEKVILTLDFNVDKSKLNQISSLINQDMSKGLNSKKAETYLENIRQGFIGAQKEANNLYNSMSKPLYSKTQAKELGSALDSVFKNIDSRLLSIQGNLTKSFNLPNNAKMLNEIRKQGSIIDGMVADYEKIASLNSQIKGLGNKTELKSELSSLTKEYEVLGQKQESLTLMEIKRQQELKQRIDEVTSALSAKADMQEQIRAIQTKNEVSTQPELRTKIDTAIDRQNAMKEAVITQADFNNLKKLLEEIRNAIRSLNTNEKGSYSQRVTENYQEVSNLNREARIQQQTFKGILRDLGVPMLTLSQVMSTLKDVARYSYNYVKNLDKALTEISVVSNKTRKEVMALTDTFIELSAKTGMAIDDIAQASTIFYQQGLDDAAVEKMTEWTALFAKISGEDVPTAADQLTAAINGFGFAAADVADVVDKMSVLAAYSAADIDELATAMSKGASQAAMAGLSFDQYNAYLATMIETTREAPENLGTSLKTIMSRFLAIKSGENTEDDTDINAVETALKSVGVQLRDSQGQLRELGDVLEELGPKWEHLDRNTQAYLGTTIAGTRQQSRFISLMQNWDRALELVEASENSAGAATKMHAAAMEGLDASLNNLINSWQKLISNIVDGDTFKVLIDTLNWLLGFFNDGNSLLKIFALAMTLFNAKTLLTNISLAAQQEKLKNLNVTFIEVGNQIQTVKTNMSNLTAEMIEQSIAAAQLRGEINALNGSYKGSSGNTVPSNTRETGDKTGGTNKTGTGGSAAKASKLIGSVQMGLMISSYVSLAIDVITDLMTKSSDEIIEKAQKAYEESQKEMDAHLDVINTVENSLSTYEKLSKKLNKSADEVEQLADAADALAKAIPSAVIGYDLDGNPIIDPNAATSARKQAEQDLADEAKRQMSSIGDLARGEIREQAENRVASEYNYDAAQTGGSWAAAIGTFGAVMMAVPEPTMITKVIGGISLAIAALGTATAITATKAENAAISQEEYNLAIEKAGKIQDEYGAKLLENMHYITSAKLKDNTVDGVSADDRNNLINYIGKHWLDSQTGNLLNKLMRKEIDEKEYEAQFKNLGNEWEEVLKTIDDIALATTYKHITKVSEDIGDKTYEEVEKSIDDIIIEQLKIDPIAQKDLYDSVKAGLMNSVYEGTISGIYEVIKDLEARKINALSIYAKGSSEYKDTEKSYNTAIKNAKTLSANELDVYASLGITDDVGLFNAIVGRYGEVIKQALVHSTEQATVQAIVVLGKYREQAQTELMKIAEAQGVSSVDEIDYDKLTDKQKEAYDKWISLARSSAYAIENAWNSLDISIDISWENLYEEMETLIERVRTVRETIAELKNDDGISYDSWKEFTTLFDDMEQFMDGDKALKYANALNTIANNLTVVNGVIQANATAMELISQIEEELIEDSREAIRIELENKKTEYELTQQQIDAQIATLEYQIAVAKGEKNTAELKKNAQKSWVDLSSAMNTFFLHNTEATSEKMVAYYADGFAAIAEKWNKLQTAMASGTVDKKTIKGLKQEWESSIKELTFDKFSDKLKEMYYDNGSWDIEAMESQLEAMKTASKNYDKLIANINLKIATIDAGLFSGKNGIGNEDLKKLDEYIGKLKEVYNIENRIQLLSHRLNTLDTYSDIAVGDQYGEYLQQRIDLTDELLDQHRFLVEEEKKFANGYAEFIESTQFADVFDFDEFGQIIINFDKYNQLQTTAVDGQKSMKEQADDLYDTYTEMFEDLQDDFDSYIKYLQKAIDLQQEVIDSYVEVERDAADAIQEIYQKILDDKLEAIDKEIEALEDLRKAREKANKAAEDAKELSGLQTDLQRAMMDTSGASDIAVIQAKDALDEKVNQMAEDRYEEMLDNIILQLENEQDALQDEFDQMFEHLDWLFEFLEENIMNDKDKLQALYEQTSDWHQKTQIEREQAIEDLSTNFATYMSELGKGKTIYDVWDRLAELKRATEALDEALKTREVNVGTAVAAAIQEGLKNNGDTSNTGGKPTGTPKGTEIDTGDEEIEKPGNQDYKNHNQAQNNLYGVGDKIKSRNRGLLWGITKAYTYDEKTGKFTKVSGGYLGGFSDKIAEVKKKNNTWYYRMKSSDRNWWVKEEDIMAYKRGGMVYNTGPAWLDGTSTKPEAVLNALQTEHFIKFTDTLDKMFANGKVNSISNGITIGAISFNVDSMSSVEDGEKAFDAFVNRFKEIGNQKGIKINSFKNTL